MEMSLVEKSPSPNSEEDSSVFLEPGEKENSSNLYERLSRRRGSAPSNLVLGDCKPSNNGNLVGSNLLRHQNNLGLNTRRGSLPSDLLKESLSKQFRNKVLNSGSAGSSKSKGLLRRRSMGPELLNLQQGGGGRERQLMQKYLNRPI